ncbi:DUF4972 domain-containing protein [Clostridium sp. CCUG 7971]|uniref:DUF4972 domain-containing protein n=1 Tax=Clostridium sp. CCUG 7971 TaxID=2811414 RepID=UPI001ABBAD5A|nr:DUF4972 domain-containing protein [Clostridium sp. CCUG 7971]MBO3445259.1 DUF4972 domain-containing protein [Clostridium sp. CCUG 7971]
MKKAIIVFMSMVISLISVGCNSSDNNDKYVHTWDYETKEYKNMNSSDLVKLRDKLIDEELKGLKKGDYDQQKKEILGNGNYQLVGFVNCLYSNMSQKDKLIKQIKLIKYSDSIDYGINPVGEFMNQTNINYQLNEFFTINKLWSKENKEKQYFNPDLLVDNFEKIYEYTDLNKYMVFNLVYFSYSDYAGEEIPIEKQATLLNKLKNIKNKKFDDRLVNKEIEKKLFLNNIKFIKTEFESRLKEENLSEIEKENIKSSLELINQGFN